MARKNVLLTLGRLPKALEIARALNTAGCRVIIADPFRFHLCRASRAVAKSYHVPSPAKDIVAFQNELLSIIKREQIDLVIPISEEAIAVSGIATALPPYTEILGATGSDLIRVHDKLTFIETSKSARLNVPQTYRADTLEASTLAEQVKTISKPRFGCSGGGICFHKPGEPISKDRLSSEFIIQERMSGREISSLSFCRSGHIEQTVLYRGLAFAGTVATAFRRLDGAHDVRRWIANFVANENYSGFIAFDFIIDDDGAVWPLECNPRLTSGIHFFEQRSLAASILNHSQPIAFKANRTFQEGHTTLALAYSQIFKRREFLRRLRIILGSRDVLWTPGDRLPFILMTPMSIEILLGVLFKGETFGQAATQDIAWTPAPRHKWITRAGSPADEQHSETEERPKTYATALES
ncbi:MAG: ATP-grasp domain-containing protein [Pseudomonadota bacterium]